MAMEMPVCASIILAQYYNNPVKSFYHFHFTVAVPRNLLSLSSSSLVSLRQSKMTLLSTMPYVLAARTVALKAEQTPSEVSVTASKVLPFWAGHGFDLHQLEPRYPLIIGGIDIPHEKGCEAHSNGDVLLHCVVDAILGALGLPDIGQIFPDSDPKWKGDAWSVLMKEVLSCYCFVKLLFVIPISISLEVLDVESVFGHSLDPDCYYSDLDHSSQQTYMSALDSFLLLIPCGN
ncbi:2-C-methyl-D-erythritol 2,4-cyclodiphosphate synthase, chloroplastic-like [Humulus lupulus]|uniref:2-C-methyl-D-erythritol 2,4-cyclodiphosphate synthase, chloroplastic-like n=1 Tax=Humulus lupulus TaxID=3486 RepID=UPI002B4078AA|nr:2-C-methyl-D-erythritol 2,4-cyclodiphosphate synthase, chloroplastic-like [Humulus lupulus]